MSIITSFRAGLAFFTRIPVGSAPLPPTLSGVVAWLPAVGLLVGALAALALLALAAFGAVRSLLRKEKKGGCSCGGDCSRCGGCH